LLRSCRVPPYIFIGEALALVENDIDSPNAEFHVVLAKSTTISKFEKEGLKYYFVSFPASYLLCNTTNIPVCQ
jgi:hypothetical protein